MKKHLTIIEVAKKIGCSPSTISRAYNEKTKMAKRVLKQQELRRKLASMGWHPNYEAAVLGAMGKKIKHKH